MTDPQFPNTIRKFPQSRSSVPVRILQGAIKFEQGFQQGRALLVSQIAAAASEAIGQRNR